MGSIYEHSVKTECSVCVVIGILYKYNRSKDKDIGRNINTLVTIKVSGYNIEWAFNSIIDQIFI